MTNIAYHAALFRDGGTCFIPVTFDPRSVFGKTRAAVKVTLNGYTYRSTIASMGGLVCIPLRKSNREAAGLEGNEVLEVRLELDVDSRTVEIPEDLSGLLTTGDGRNWAKLSFTRQRELVESITSAKRVYTRRRRIDRALQEIRST